MRITALSVVMTVTLLALGTSVTAGPSGEALAYTCAGCHGTDGSSVGPSSPHLAGMNAEYFVESMQEYREDERNPTIMNRLAKGYTDEQLEAMAEFFANQTLRLTPQQSDVAQAKLGAEYHEKYCEKCHEEGGRKSDDAGILAGQWAPYLRFSLDDYRSGERDMTKKMGKKMKSMEKDHGAEAFEALIHYYAGQK